MTLPSVSFVVAAAGQGTRVGGSLSKQYRQLQGRPLLDITLQRLLDLEPRQLVLVVAADDRHWHDLARINECTVVHGGASRAESVSCGLAGLDGIDTDWVMVHDAARPCVRGADIMRLARVGMLSSSGAVLGVPVVDTVKQVTGNLIVASPARETLWLAQTPQLFPLGLLQKALAEAQQQQLTVTDEASAVAALGLQPLMVQGSRDNIKVTVETDLALAAWYLDQQGQLDPSLNGPSLPGQALSGPSSSEPSSGSSSGQTSCE